MLGWPTFDRTMERISRGARKQKVNKGVYYMGQVREKEKGFTYPSALPKMELQRQLAHGNGVH